ncbi:hypothetical protein F0562_033003 [Nyssa sinensis]|uniref:F-box domain-containing protein n=1 Tax=Nyssa sinensis TaxID=561372 RepID=A0A5J5AQL2_9ASTE|nr:hypothetical protein F0562_033003 [Nyssa sinensis]
MAKEGKGRMVICTGRGIAKAIDYCCNLLSQMVKKMEKGRRRMAREEEKGKMVIVSGNDIAEAMDYCCNLLPGDLILNILSRLPIKCLWRFRCVCKTWFNIVLSPTFISMHLRRSNNKKNNVSLFYQHCCSRFSVMSLCIDKLDTELFLPFQLSRAIAIGSSNGLVCIKTRDYDLDLILWNPATREFRHLPEPIFCEHLFYSSEFAFHHHPIIDDYQLVRFCFYYDDGGRNNIFESVLNARIEVFTLSTNSWREIGPVVMPRQNFKFNNLVPVNGSLHWMAMKFQTSSVEEFVVAFDMVEEKFRQIEVACSDCAAGQVCRSLSAFKETLAMLVLPTESNSCFDIWVLNDYGSAKESWIKLLSIGPIPIAKMPQGFWIDGDVIVNGFKHDKGAFLYDPHTKEIKNFPSCMEATFEIFCYTESLVSVRRSNKNNNVSLLHQHSYCRFSVISLCINNLDTELHLSFRVSKEAAIVGSSNGLVCIKSLSNINPNLILWNPATREFRPLPKPEIFEDHIYSSEFSFHYHSSIDDYKLVRFCFYYDDDRKPMFERVLNARIEVFTFGTNSWRETERVIMPCQYFRFNNRVSVNGSLNLMGIKIGNLIEDIVVAFDMVEEKFRQIKVACLDNANYGQICWTLTAFKDNLAMFVFPLCLTESNSCFDVWILNDYGGAEESWTKQLTIGPIPIAAAPQGFWINGEVIMKSFKHGGNVFLYDPRTQEIKNFPSYMAERCEFFRYTETLVSVKQ